MMVCETIWADRVASRGVEAALVYKELVIVTTKKTRKQSTNRRQPSRANPMKGSHAIKSKIS